MLLDILTQGDLCTLATVVLILIWVGSILSRSSDRRVGTGLAIAAFLGHGAYALCTRAPRHAEDLLDLTLRALCVGGLTLGIAWIAQPLLTVVGFGFFVLPLRTLRAALITAQQNVASHIRSWKEDAKRRQDDKNWHRAAPERERAQKEAEAQAKIANNGKRRREDAVAAAEVKFALHQHELGEKFTSQMFQDFLKKYMGDERPAQYVEERSRQLQDIITQLVAKGSRPDVPSTLSDLELWFQNQKRTIEQSGLDETEKKIKVLHLQKRYDDLFTRLIHGA